MSMKAENRVFCKERSLEGNAEQQLIKKAPFLRMRLLYDFELIEFATNDPLIANNIQAPGNSPVANVDLVEVNAGFKACHIHLNPV